MSGLPDKLYFRIGEVASLVGVEPHVLRYWEREFRTIRPTKSAKGQRIYSRRDVESLIRVRELLYAEGFTIAGAKKKLGRAGGTADAHGQAQHAADAEAELQADAEPQTQRMSVEEQAHATAAHEEAERLRGALREVRTEIEALLHDLGDDPP